MKKQVIKSQLVIGLVIMLVGVCKGQDSTTYKSQHSYYVDFLPFDTNQQLIAQHVVEVEGASAEQLYSAAKQYFSTNYTNAEAKVYIEDPDNYVIAGSKSMEIKPYFFITPEERIMYYSLKIECKEGRYKLSIFDIYFVWPLEQGGIKELPDDLFMKNVYYKNWKKKTTKKYNESHAHEMLKAFTLLTTSVKKAMQLQVVKDDW